MRKWLSNGQPLLSKVCWERGTERIEKGELEIVIPILSHCSMGSLITAEVTHLITDLVEHI